MRQGKCPELRGLRLIEGQMQRAFARRRMGRYATRQTRRRLQRRQLAFPEHLAGRHILRLQPGDIVAVMPLDHRQRLAGVMLQDFAKQLGTAPTVQQDVVVGIDQMKTLGTGTHQFQAQQRRPFQHKPLCPCGLAQCVECRLLVGARLPVVFGERQHGIAVDRLQRLRLRVLPDKPGAQHVMPRQHLRPGTLETWHIQALDISA
ncbi:hypothetical protein [Pseudomonas sp. 52 E 6]|nr:hypothetical protein [Pseudomonas sp. 52 E 6]